MAIAIDASSPVRWSAVLTSGGAGMTSAPFTAPANAWLELTVSMDGHTSGQNVFGTLNVSDSGSLVWTERVRRSQTESVDGGASVILTARTTSAVERTVLITRTAGGTVTKRCSAKLYVKTSVDVDGTPIDTVGANNEGGSTANPLTTTSVTPGATGQLTAVTTEWQQLGLLTSSDLTLDTADYTGAISVASGYKACTSGVGVTANLDPPVGTPQHKWCQVVDREAAGGAATSLVPPPANKQYMPLLVRAA